MHDLTIQTTPSEKNLHEIDGCDACHGDHNNPLEDYETCGSCVQWLKERADQIAFEFHFTVDDVRKAQEWARAHKYRYESVEHLLHDALIEKVIHTDRWKAA